MNKGLPVLLSMTILSGIALSSTFVSADNTEVIDTVELTVPVACTMSGTGTTHTATLNPGTYSGASGSEYENGIGKTTLTAICNDDNGFSIYAIGYTGDEYGVTNLIGSNTNGTIATKAYASGDTTSNWSMKLTKVTDTSESYNPQNLTISTGYDNWIAVPATYTKVAQYKANTGSSTTDTTLGAKLETTYAAYIASSQAADTYVGQVKYTMVHPYDGEAPRPKIAQVTVQYNAGGAYFNNDPSWKTNVVTYGVYCPSATNYLVYSTPNINQYGEKSTSLSELIVDNYYFSDISIPGAHRLKIVLSYDFSFNEENPLIESEYGDYYEHGGITIFDNTNQTIYYGDGAQTVIVEGDTATIAIEKDNTVTIDPNHDYGYYALVYPLDENDETYSFNPLCTWNTIDGTYVEPTFSYIYWSFSGWEDMAGFTTTSINAESQVFRYLEDNNLPSWIEIYNIP